MKSITSRIMFWTVVLESFHDIYLSNRRLLLFQVNCLYSRVTINRPFPYCNSHFQNWNAHSRGKVHGECNALTINNELDRFVVNVIYLMFYSTDV